ncbi:hypothetical protein NQ314_015090 [Rhamnusium bicolor]|uniref:DUF4371 domain-containing protein n=1 Tax=Rhamnusium bicolor TaxID=1586634 RepID=A0AAV8WZQ3_9CUCU|nr:hypothetical protein NQ314_015090 [Rhamnusium bicolor]
MTKTYNRSNEEVQKNRKILTTIIETIVFCGRQELSLRGHRDSGKLSLTEQKFNDGNLRALLRYQFRGGDLNLQDHIINANANATYISSDIQNELISITASHVQSLIVKKIEKSKFYSVLADETTDISRIEQFSLCIRYVDEDEDGMKLREDFLTFVPVHDFTGATLASTLKETLVSLGLNLNNLRGQGYDGASAMRGSFRGVQSIIREAYPTAVYTHCASHCLNLCLSDASKVTSIRNAFGTISEVCTFSGDQLNGQTSLKTD